MFHCANMASGHMSEHTLLINIPNWHGADRLAMYKRSRWVEPETQLEQILFVVRAGLELEVTGFQVRRTKHLCLMPKPATKPRCLLHMHHCFKKRRKAGLPHLTVAPRCGQHLTHPYKRITRAVSGKFCSFIHSHSFTHIHSLTQSVIPFVSYSVSQLVKLTLDL